MIKTIYNDGDLIIRIDTFLKYCVQCGRLCQYRIRYKLRHYGWRLCWEHLSKELRNKIEDYYHPPFEKSSIIQKVHSLKGV